MSDNSPNITIDKLKEQLEESIEENNQIAMISHNRGHKISEQREYIKELKKENAELQRSLAVHDFLDTGVPQERLDYQRELKKEILRLKSLCRRSADEIRDLDNIIIKLHDQFPEIKKELNWNSDGYWAGEASINLLNRLDGRTNGGYIENYDDLHLEMKTLGETDSKAENKLTLQEARELTIEGAKRMEELERSQDDDYDYDCDDVRHHCGACGCEPCQCK